MTKSKAQAEFVLGGVDGLSSADQEYNPTPIINEIRTYVDTWRSLPNRTSGHTRDCSSPAPLEASSIPSVRPFFCQIEVVETAIWLAEVAPKMGRSTAKFLEHLKGANAQSNPDLFRIAPSSFCTGAGKPP